MSGLQRYSSALYVYHAMYGLQRYSMYTMLCTVYNGTQNTIVLYLMYKIGNKK